MRFWICIPVLSWWGLQPVLAGVVTNYAYDQAGDMTKSWVVDGSTTVSRTETVYDILGRQSKVTQFGSEADATKNVVTHYVYDVAGNLVTKKVETGQSSAYMMTVYVYDDLGRQVTVKGPSTSVYATSAPQARYGYDAGGNMTLQLVRIKHGDNETSDYAVTRIDYDALNRATKTYTKIDATTEQCRESAYDSHGRVIRERVGIEDAWQQQDRMEYDGAGRLTRRVRMANPMSDISYHEAVDRVMEYTYDADGRVLSETAYDQGYPARPLVAHYRYDGLGRLTKKIDAEGHYDQMVYDSRGFVVTQIRFDGQEHTTIASYSNQGRLLSSTELGTPDLTTGYQYDGMGHRTLVTDPAGKQTYYEYDLLGHATMMVEDYGGLNRQTDYVFDQQGRLYQQIAHNDSSFQTTTYGYTTNGQQGTITYPDNGVLTFEYYPSGAVSRRVDQANGILEYFYDFRGLMLTKRNPAETYLVRYEYDSIGRIGTAKKGPDGNIESQVVYEYDGLSNVTNENQLTASNRTAKDVVSEYDQSGSRTRLNYPQ